MSAPRSYPATEGLWSIFEHAHQKAIRECPTEPTKARRAGFDAMMGIIDPAQGSPEALANKVIADPTILHLRECGFQPAARFEATLKAAIMRAVALTSTHSRCAKCHCETKGEAALVDGKIWCHPCADSVPSTSRCTCAAIVNPNIPHARTCPLSSSTQEKTP